MPRKPELQAFLDAVASYKGPDGLLRDDLPRDLETVATKREVGWWKYYQFLRAMRHARKGIATNTELIYLANRNVYYPTTPKVYLRQAKKHARQQRAHGQSRKLKR